MNLYAIKPDETGKYSPLLYKHLTNKRKPPRGHHVFQMLNRYDGEDYSEYWRLGKLVLGAGEFDADGKPKWISGRTIGSIVSGARGQSALTFAYGPGFGFRDITEAFWKEYERIGRCAWDYNHHIFMVGDEQRYTASPDGKSRVCNWCGAKHEAVEREKTERWIEWVPAA